MSALRSILLFSLFCGVALAEPMTRSAERVHEGVVGKVNVHLSQSDLSVSDSLMMMVEVIVPKGYEAQLPEFAEYGFSLDFHERSRRFRPTDIGNPTTEQQPDGVIVLRQEFTLEPWLSGNYSLPPLMVSFFKKGSEDAQQADPALAFLGPVPEFSVITNAIRLDVKPLPEDRQDLSDIYPQSDYQQDKLKKRVRRQEDKSDEELRKEQEEKKKAVVALNERRFPWWLIWTLLGGGFVLGLGWLVLRRRIAALLMPPKAPAHEIAYAALEELQSKQLPQKGKIKEFYYELSYILREYVGNRFGLFAVHQTTEEFLRSLLVTNPFDKMAEQTLRNFSEHADTVKYSLFRPDPAKAEDSFGIARTFVDNTKHVEEKS